MARSETVALLAVLAVVALLNGCATSVGGNLAIDYNQSQIPGSITISDPKLYRREALINERRREIQYLDALLQQSERPDFQIGPDVIRQVEFSRALMASAGVAIDQGFRESNKRSNQLSEMRDELELINWNAEMALARRNFQLLTDSLASQTVPSEGFGKPNPSQGIPLQSPSPPNAEASLARLDSMQAAAITRLGTPTAALAPVNMAGNPADQFRDRAAYRQLLTSARNAASLDELHDLDGSSLYRLTFQVTTLPPPISHRRAVGMVEMRPVNEEPTDDEVADIYGLWLDYIYRRMAAASPDYREQHLILGTLSTTGLFDTLQLFYEPAVLPKPAAAKGGAVGKANQRNCNVLASLVDDPGHCQARLLVVPKIAPDERPGDMPHSMVDLVKGDLVALNDLYTPGLTTYALTDLQAMFLEPKQCKLLSTQVRRSRAGQDPSRRDVTRLIESAHSFMEGAPYLLEALQAVAFAQQSDPRQSRSIEAVRKEILMARIMADSVLNELGKNVCGTTERLYREPTVMLPQSFARVVREGHKQGIRIYEVSPREQVQQVSTAARAAEAMSFAIAMAANAQSAGASASAGLGYSRNAIARADLIERLPSVVGFSQNGGAWRSKGTGRSNGDGTARSKLGVSSREKKDDETDLTSPKFGWVFSPRVNSIDPKKGSLEVQQGQRTYDVSADIAVSGWRTKLRLEAYTAWAPDWHSESVVAAMSDPSVWQVTDVRLRPSDGELSELTNRLAAVSGGGHRVLSMRIQQPRVMACTKSTILLEGANLWRATDVLIGNLRVSGDAISVLPDMLGITVEVPAQSLGSSEVPVQVLTPLGVARGQSIIVDGFDAKGCDKPQVATADAATATVVNKVDPEAVNICSSPTFMLQGANLDKLSMVRLELAEGVLSPAAKKGSERKVSFKRDDLAQISTPFASMKFEVGDKTLAAKTIAITLNCGGKS